MPILIPRSAAPQHPPVRIGVYVTLDQLGGPHATVTDLTTDLGKVRRSEVIRCIVAIASRLTAPKGRGERLQWELANELLSDDLLAELKRYNQSMEWHWAVFHRRQLLFLVQLAASACREDTATLDQRTMAHTIGRACLIVNSILHEHEPQQNSDRWKEDYNFCFVPSFIRALDQAPQMEVLARAYMLWFELQKQPAVIKHFRKRKVPLFAAAFEAKYSLSFERFFLIAMSLWSHYHNLAAGKASAVLVESDQYLVPHFGRDDVFRAMLLLAQTPDVLAQNAAKAKKEQWIDDSSLLMAHPLIEVFPGKYACPDLCYLHRFLTERIYFLLKDAYSDNRFQELFGHVFDEYIGTVIGQFGIENDRFRTYWRSPKFVRTTAEACDGLLCTDEVALVMENKARLLMLQEKYAGVPELTWRGIQDIVGKPGSDRSDPKGVFQLARNIARMLNGEEMHTGRARIRLTGTQRVIPALVAYEDAVSLGAVRRWADARLREGLKEYGIDPEKVGQLIILNTHDIERLEALTHKSEWVKMITGYADYAKAHPDDPIATFDVFSLKASLPSEDPGASFLAKTFSQAIAFTQASLPIRTADNEGAAAMPPPYRP